MPDFDMGTYAAFVWPAWGLSALVLGSLVVRATRSARHWQRELAGLNAAPARCDDTRTAPTPRVTDA